MTKLTSLESYYHQLDNSFHHLEYQIRFPWPKTATVCLGKNREVDGRKHGRLHDRYESLLLAMIYEF